MTDQLGIFVLLSVAWVISCSLTIGLVLPLQQMLFVNFSINIGLCFLPHGIRILAFYYFGWRGNFLPATSKLSDDHIVKSNGDEFAFASPNCFIDILLCRFPCCIIDY